MDAEIVIRHLRERARFWRQFPAHRDEAKRLDKELNLLEAEWVQEKLRARSWTSRQHPQAETTD